MKLYAETPGQHVAAFMRQMHRHDGGRTLPLLHAAGVTTAQLAALEAARRPRTISALALEFGLSLPAMSQLVDKLVRAGLLLRSEDVRDRRRRHIVVTRKASALLERIATARAARFDAALAHVPAGVRAELSAVLAKVVIALETPAAREALP